MTASSPMKVPFRIIRYVVLCVILLVTSYQLSAWRKPNHQPQKFEVDLKGHSRDGYPYPKGPDLPAEQHAATVIDVFRAAWHGYSVKCFGHDEILPVSGKCSNSRNGWGASIVDALSTALIMGQKDIVEDILDYIPSINFARCGGWPRKVSVFETTIRYLAGLLSAYDLLDSGLKKDLDVEEWKVDALLVQARLLGDKLLKAFDTPSGVPVNWLWFELGIRVPNQRENTLAAAGTLFLEFQRLSDLTDDQRYADAVSRAMGYILKPKLAEDLEELQPGLLATWISTETGEFTDVWGSWGAGRDSAYEYLLKAFIYDHRKYRDYGDKWQDAANATIHHAASYPTVREGEAFLMDWGAKRFLRQADYLSSFAAGNFLLAGSVYSDESYTKFGLELINGLRALQTATATGIGPEKFSWTRSPFDQAEFYAKNGWWIRDGKYNTRPEVLESYYYAYRVTSDEKYRDWSWELFQNVLKACTTNWGLSSIDDVNAASPKLLDFQDSFLFSEVLKYAYMTFADGTAPWQVQKDRGNSWVFNTEGHPLRARCTMPTDLTHIGSCGARS